MEGAGEGGVVGGEGVVDVGIAQDGATGLEALIVEVCCCWVLVGGDVGVIVGRHFGGMSGGGAMLMIVFLSWNFVVVLMLLLMLWCGGLSHLTVSLSETVKSIHGMHLHSMQHFIHSVSNNGVVYVCTE